MSFAFDVTEVKLLDADALKKKFHVEPGGLAQQMLEKEIIRRSIPYCPHDTGVLENSASSATVLGSGEIIYPGPYAHYQYYGQVYGPSFPIFEDDSGVPTKWRSRKGIKKHPTGRELTYKTDQNPNAGPFWVTRMWADHSKDIIEEVRHAAGVE